MVPVISNMRSVVLGGAALAFSELAMTPTLAYMMESKANPKVQEKNEKNQNDDFRKRLAKIVELIGEDNLDLTELVVREDDRNRYLELNNKRKVIEKFVMFKVSRDVLEKITVLGEEDMKKLKSSFLEDFSEKPTLIHPVLQDFLTQFVPNFGVVVTALVRKLVEKKLFGKAVEAIDLLETQGDRCRLRKELLRTEVFPKLGEDYVMYFGDKGIQTNQRGKPYYYEGDSEDELKKLVNMMIESLMGNDFYKMLLPSFKKNAHPSKKR